MAVAQESGEYTMLVRVYAVIHRCEKKSTPGAPSQLYWTALGSASWCDLRFFVNKAGDTMKLEGHFEDGSLFGVQNVVVSAWRWGRRSKDRFCTLQRHKHATGAYGFYFPDDGIADRISLIVNRYIAPKTSSSEGPADAPAAAEATPHTAAGSGGDEPAASSSPPPSDTPSKQESASPFVEPADLQTWLSGKQFAMDVDALPCTSLPVYGKVPNVLLFLASQLQAAGGLTSEGIFRVSGDKAKVAGARLALDSGDAAQALAQMDANVASNLIKLFFRSLTPQALLNAVPEAKFVPAARGSLDSIAALMEDPAGVPSASRGLFLWLLDIMAAVVGQQPSNRMGAQAISVVIAPNLYMSETDNPMRAMEMTQMAVLLLRQAVTWRMANPAWTPPA